MYKSTRKMTCVEKMRIFLGGWVVVCSLGGESWERGDILAFTDGVPDGHILSI
jgi:hypothetical protein